MKIVYRYDENGYYTSEYKCQLDPLVSKKLGHDVYLIPPKTTEIKPPKEKEGNKIKWNADKNKWQYEKIPEEKGPEEYKPTEEELLQNQINAKKWELSQTDYRTLKFIDGEYTEEEYAVFKEQRQQLRDEINQLQQQLEDLKNKDE